MKALVIAAYMGPLPPLLPLWLRSAACNPGLDFLLVSDQTPPSDLPANLQFASRSLVELQHHWSEVTGIDVALAHPYKLNDFKPLYWTLAPDLDRYDYWAYCDLDVIFGDLVGGLGLRLGRYAMVLSEGHLRFMRNDAATREAWRRIVAPRRWQDILSDPANFGMDEHHGINRVFADPARSWFADPARVADIHPSFRQLRRLSHLPNAKHQAFYWQGGRVYREFVADGRTVREEYLYIHLQKRSLPVDPACIRAEAFNIDAGGIVPRQAGDGSPKAIARRNPWHFPSLAEARIQLRQWRARMLRTTPDFPVVDRPDQADDKPS